MLDTYDIQKIRKRLKYFMIKATFNLPDLQDYDNEILEKIKNPELYKEILYINLRQLKSENFYG